MSPEVDTAAFEDALERAKAESRVLLVRFTSSHEREEAEAKTSAWRVPGVRTWIGEHGQLVEIAREARPELLDRFAVTTTPAVLAFRDGVLIDRLIGAHSAPALMAWFEGLLHRTPELVELRKAAHKGGVRERHALARTLLLEGRDDEALEHYLWLWTCGLEQEPGWRGVRYSFLLAELAELIRRSVRAREAFAGYRDLLDAQLGNNPAGVLADWFALNQALGEVERSLGWFDAQPAEVLERIPQPLLQQWLSGPLKTRGRWAELARLYPQPLASLKLRHRLIAQVVRGKSEAGAEVDRFAHQSFREHACDLVRALFAAGRAAEADEVADQARALHPGPALEAALAEVMPKR